MDNEQRTVNRARGLIIRKKGKPSHTKLL